MTSIFKKVVSIFILLVLASVVIFVLTGCGTVAEDARNVSSRPWNAPKTWEGPLPSTINEGR